MKRFCRVLLPAVLLGAVTCGGGSLPGDPLALAAEPPQNALPVFAGGETLRFKLLWPSGVYLGEAVLIVSPAEKELHFDLTVEADLPTHNIADSFSSVATREGLCSLQFQKKGREGVKISEESIGFDQKAHQARRTSGGQTTSLPIPDCARDPLTFLYYFRSQIGTGNSVNTASFFVGAGYRLEIKRAGTETVSAGGKQRPAEKYVVTYSGPNSAKTFDLWVSADARREPVVVRMPFPLALFSAELQ